MDQASAGIRPEVEADAARGRGVSRFSWTVAKFVHSQLTTTRLAPGNDRL